MTSQVLESCEVYVKIITMKTQLFIVALLVISLSCRPVLTIGWSEIGILIVLFAVLLGPVIFKFARRMNEFQAWKTNKGKQKEKKE